MIKVCNKCKIEYQAAPFKKDNRCNKCWNDYKNKSRKEKKLNGTYVRDYGKHSKEYLKKYWKEYLKRPDVKLKMYSRYITRKAIKEGLLIKKPCEICGFIQSEIHHIDYSKPLEIKWLCKEHHIKEHGKNLYKK